jgi:hypothetical protein
VNSCIESSSSSPDEVIFFLVLPFQPHYGSNVHSDSNRNEYQKMFLGCRARPAGKADNPSVICKPIV